MTRFDAVNILYEIINSGIISEEFENDLTDIVNLICNRSCDDFEACPSVCLRYCKLDSCPHVKPSPYVKEREKIK